MRISETNQSPSSNSPPYHPKPRRRRTANSAGLGTPTIRWKFVDAPATGRRFFRRVKLEATVSVSARKLGAGLWHLSAPHWAFIGPLDRVGFELGVAHSRIKFPFYHVGGDYGVKTKAWLQSPNSDCGPKHVTLYKEGATKWDPGHPKPLTEVSCFLNHMKLLENQQFPVVSVGYTLQSELVKARAHIHDLETDRQSSKKKVERFLMKLSEERNSWMRNEHQKLREIVDELKHELNTERRKYQKMKDVNSKLLIDLADARLFAKKFMQNYEKEVKNREIFEEICHDLAKKIEEDKSQVEASNEETRGRTHEEIEEERKMLQLAEVWREERVQMKLIDAKLILEEKYFQMNNLVADLETFLRSRDVHLDMIEMSEAEVIRQAVKSVDIQDIKEFSYSPPKSNDIYSMIEDLRNDESIKSQIRQFCSSRSRPTHEFHESNVDNHSNAVIDHDRGLEGTSGLETATQNEGRGSSYIPNGSNRCVNNINRGKCFLSDGTEYDKNEGQESLNSDISEICSVSSAKESKKKTSSARKTWRSNPSNGNVRKLRGRESFRMGTASHDGGVVCHDLVGALGPT